MNKNSIILDLYHKIIAGKIEVTDKRKTLASLYLAHRRKGIIYWYPTYRRRYRIECRYNHQWQSHKFKVLK